MRRDQEQEEGASNSNELNAIPAHGQQEQQEEEAEGGGGEAAMITLALPADHDEEEEFSSGAQQEEEPSSAPPSSSLLHDPAEHQLMVDRAFSSTGTVLHPQQQLQETDDVQQQEEAKEAEQPLLSAYQPEELPMPEPSRRNVASAWNHSTPILASAVPTAAGMSEEEDDGDNDLFLASQLFSMYADSHLGGSFMIPPRPHPLLVAQVPIAPAAEAAAEEEHEDESFLSTVINAGVLSEQQQQSSSLSTRSTGAVSPISTIMPAAAYDHSHNDEVLRLQEVRRILEAALLASSIDSEADDHEEEDFFERHADED
jgi:hypothetical protein